MTATAFRKDLYKSLDEVATTGVPLEISSKGKWFELTPKKKVSKLARLKPHNSIVSDPDELVDLKVWEWTEEKNL